VSLLSKKIALSVTPAGATLSCSDWLIHFDVPQSLEKMATANALGIASGDISEALKGFSKVHSRVLAHTFFENIEGTVTEDTAEVQWMSPKVTKIHCLQAPETWFCVSVWTAYDAVEEKELSWMLQIQKKSLLICIVLRRGWAHAGYRFGSSVET